MSDENCLISFEELSTYAIATIEEEWKTAIVENIITIEKNHSWTFVKCYKEIKLCNSEKGSTR